MRSLIVYRSLLFTFLLLVLCQGAFAQLGIGISVSFGPPALPVYEQPICPAADYIWAPGYWAYDDQDGYYWVPGTWVEAPQVGFLWTPGYWGWGGSAFFFHEGYWGRQVGFYGGINYGFGYGGRGYEGGRWDGNHFSYNTYVNHVNTTIIHNTYNVRVTNISETHVSYNGGNGGIGVRPTPQEQSYANQRHAGPVAAQTQHVNAARGNPQLRASVNQGRPPIAATARAGDFKAGAVPTRQAGGEYRPPPANAAHANANHASELQSHTVTPPNAGNPAANAKYQQRQNRLAAQQNQEHQQLQQQQEREHQAASQKNYNDSQKQQMEQRHTQQSQQLEQKHATQQTQLQQRQGPRQSAPKAEKSH